MLFLGQEITSLKKQKLYAILDIETTGGKFNEEGITEIAIYKFDGHTVVDQFISLINPEREIQPFVVQLTGINNNMLQNAPKFFEVAKRIIEITKDCVLVAHNTSFDYRILRTEFDRLGFNFYQNTLCTIQLSKHLIPNQESYSLGKLCKALAIPMNNRHRASGDALATVQLFKLLLEKDVDKKIIRQSVKFYDHRSKNEKLTAILDAIPEVYGVFYVHNDDGKVIFMGKGKNIKKSVNQLFLKDTKRALKIQEVLSSVSYEKTGNELITQLKYHTELEELKPKYNFKRKRKIRTYDFLHPNMLLIDKGRAIEENSIIFVENNEVFGYGYTNLAFQENQINILKSLLTPMKNKELSKIILKNYLQKKNTTKIVKL